MARRLTFYILIAMTSGIIVGFVVNQAADPAAIVTITDALSILTGLFLKLIKMIIAPLVLATLFGGIAHMGDSSALGRMGGRTIGWFLLASVVSLTLGLVFVNLFRPGVGLNLPLPPAHAAAAGVQQAHFSLHDFILDLVPSSIFDALAKNAILPIVVFATFAGIAATAIGERAAPLIRAADAVTHMMLQITDYVMRVAPFAVFAAVTSAVAKEGLGILVTFGYFMGGFYVALAVLWALLFTAAFVAIGGRAKTLFRYIRDPFLIGFTTASSEAAFPRTLEELERFGVPRRIGGFVLPLGYSFNLDGSMMYCSFATMFIAQAYGISLTVWQQATMLLLLMVTSKGIASVPRASLVVISATLTFFNIPEGGLLLILAVDQFLDMGRTGTNVVGNAVAATLVAKWEGVLEPSRDPNIEPLPTP